MQNLQRRASGIYITRLTVPVYLRKIVGKREFIVSTGTHHLAVAKLVAAATLAKWRQQFMDLERLALGNPTVTPENLLKLVDGHPLLSADTYLPLRQAASAVGLSCEDLLRAASEGRMNLFHRFAGQPGFLVLLDELEVDDHIEGTRVVPLARDMPENAISHLGMGLYAVPSTAVAAVASCFLKSEKADLVLFDAPNGDRTRGFAPSQTTWLERDSIEVKALEVDAIRKALMATITPDRISNARETAKGHAAAVTSSVTPRSERLMSRALEDYAKSYLPNKITQAKEIERVRAGIALFIEFEGDLPITAIDSERLRRFRDDHLSRLPANENRVRIKYGTKSMSASVAAVEGQDWPRMSANERTQRMQWIARMFKWCRDQNWIDVDPMTGLRGEAVQSKAESKKAATEKVLRVPFTPAELTLIFAAPWFLSGKGELTAKRTYREFCPFKFWLPLLGVYSGARINELCQLRLADVCQTGAGTWYLDINDATVDKSLKRQSSGGRCWSARKVPVHPMLVELGFVDWCERLKEKGYKRLFPELSWNAQTHYAKEPIRAMSQLFGALGMARDNTKVFHSFRHGMNNALLGAACQPETRKRLMGHEPGAGVNEQHYLADPSPDETIKIIRALDFGLPFIQRFDLDEGLKAIDDALRRKNQNRGGSESLGPA